MTRYITLGCAAAMIALAACDSDKLVNPKATPLNTGLFKSYVAIGNSITAGFQSGGILDSTQQESFAAILAHQAGTRYAYPALLAPGCPPPVVSFPSTTLGGPGAPPCSLRDPRSVNAILNNVAVPGAAAIDPLAATSMNSNALTTLILGGKTQVQKALDASPTFVTIEIGNNDVLSAALHGTTVPDSAIGSPGITPVATVVSEYSAMMSALLTGQPKLKGALFGVFAVTALPSLFPAESLYTNAQFNAEFTFAAGGSVTYVPNCIGSHALISIDILAFWKAANIPPVVSCQAGVPVEPYGNLFVLDTLKQAAFASAIAGYDAYIQAKADSLGWVYFDPNPLLGQLKAAGAVPTLPNLASTTQTFGPFITLDGIHPSALAHEYIANKLIQGINAKYSVSIDTVPHP
ncbi:MAG TPA: SGNH/GDSL hydrolase family protein [Gemmatimonadaceae bacterium]|nr:SGNH/GDSL hydrolase family protein [Gemmatimonadaceae bacterium]